MKPDSLRDRQSLEQEYRKVARDIAKGSSRGSEQLDRLNRIAEELKGLDDQEEQLLKEVVRFKRQFWKLSDKLIGAGYTTLEECPPQHIDDAGECERKGSGEDEHVQAQEDGRSLAEAWLEELLLGGGRSTETATGSVNARVPSAKALAWLLGHTTLSPQDLVALLCKTEGLPTTDLDTAINALTDWFLTIRKLVIRTYLIEPGVDPEDDDEDDDSVDIPRDWLLEHFCELLELGPDSVSPLDPRRIPEDEDDD